MNNSAMFKIGYGLYVLTAKENGKLNGCIVNTVSQVTTTPNRVIIAVNKGNLTHDMIKASGEFNVSVLSESAPFSIFKNFGYQSGRTADKFAGTAHKLSANQLPYLIEHCNAYISCKVVSATDLGTHTLFLADVVDADVLSSETSVTYDYYQKNIKPKPAASEPKKGWRCKICGYVYEGEELPADFICPICKHGAADFEKIG